MQVFCAKKKMVFNTCARNPPGNVKVILQLYISVRQILYWIFSCTNNNYYFCPDIANISRSHQRITTILTLPYCTSCSSHRERKTEVQNNWLRCVILTMWLGKQVQILNSQSLNEIGYYIGYQERRKYL